MVLAVVDEKEVVPNFAAYALSPGMGWLLCACVVGFALAMVAHRQTWRTLWFRSEDPRPVALFRIAFGLCTLCNVNGLWEHFEYLFTDEGMWSTDVAQHHRARLQFEGFGDGNSLGEPWGFVDARAFLQWLKGPNYSLLLLESSPQFFWIHLWVFEFFMFAFIVGWQTRWTKWVAWFLFLSIIQRNGVFWEGTENVYRSFLFYLCIARCDRAYSVDNWLRCRGLRKLGRLSEPGGVGEGRGAAPSSEHPKGLEAIYRTIPAWPRLLMILQTATIYTNTGMVKNGSVWMAGDAFYYAFNLDHFYRMPPQAISAMFGTNLFRINTHITHWWEVLFPLVVVGLVVRWVLHEGEPLRLWEQRLARFGFTLSGLAIYAMILYALPVHYPDDQSAALPLEAVLWMVAIGLPLICLGLGRVMWRLANRAYRVYLPWPKRTYAVDLDWFCRWFLGRRTWLFLGLCFHGHLIVMMNVGWFSPALLASYIPFLNGAELAQLAARTWHRLARMGVPGPARHVATPSPIGAEDPRLPWTIRDGFAIPPSLLFTLIAMGFLGVMLHATTVPDMWTSVAPMAAGLPEALLVQPRAVHMGWTIGAMLVLLLAITVRVSRGRSFDPRWSPVLLVALAVLAIPQSRQDIAIVWSLVLAAAIGWVATRRRSPRPADLLGRSSRDGIPPAWAYGPLGRAIVGFLVVFHCFGVAIWLMPEKDCMGTFRHIARTPFRWWLDATNTAQGWKMFAPNPPRRNIHMRVLVHDSDGQTYDLNNDVYACLQEGSTQEICDAVYPIPWIWYSRAPKMNRRIGGGEGGKGVWYQKYHAAYICRRWALDHDGVMPEKVEILQVGYPVPSPQEVAKRGPYDPKKHYNKTATQKSMHTTRCATQEGAQLTNEIRARYGLPEVDPKSIRVNQKKRCSKWEKKLRNEAIARGEEVADDDPRFLRCPEPEE